MQEVTNSETHESVFNVSEPFASEVAKNQQSAEQIRKIDAEMIVKNRRIRHNPGKGLPHDEDLRKLATVYLETQYRLWPELVARGLIPKVTEVSLDKMVNDFRFVFLNREIPMFDADRADGASLALAVAYLRYSYKQQNARSLDDQLYHALTRARQDKVFIPWCYVCADAGVTATIANRTGYKIVKSIPAHKELGRVSILYIDEIDRASREGIETLQLGKLVTDLNKRLIGVSCGFDSEDPSAKMKLYFYAMFNEQYVDQLRTKVTRGKRGAARRGTSAGGRPPFGIKLAPAIDSNGNALVGSKGRSLNRWVRDESAAWAIQLMAKLFVDERWSFLKICREFNRQRIGGKACWKQPTISQMLRNPAYVGIMITNRLREVRNPATGTVRQEVTPRKQWIVRRNRDMAIFSWKRWKQIRERLADVKVCRPKGRKAGAMSKCYPSRLLRGTLCCGYDGTDLVLGRAGSVAYYSCTHHGEQAYGCRLTTYRQVAIIENAILDYIRDRLLTEERIAALVDSANNYLAEEAARPRPNADGLRQTLIDTTAKLNRLIDLATDGLGDNSQIRRRIEAVTAEIEDLKQAISESDSANPELLPPLDKENVLSLLTDMRKILLQDVQNAAPLIRQVLGKVPVRQETLPGAKKPVWIATMHGDLLPLVAHAAKIAAFPDSYTAGELCVRNWKNTVPDEVVIRSKLRKYEIYVAPIMALTRLGLGKRGIAKQLGISVDIVQDARRFARNQPVRVEKRKSRTRRKAA